MKTKISLLSIACCIAMFSCTKSSDKTTANPVTAPVQTAAKTKYAVNFKLGKVDVNNGGRVGNKEVAVSEYLHTIFYGAYDSAGHLVSKIIQDRREQPFPHFGEIADSLPEGRYTIVVAAGQGDVAFGDTSRLEALLIGNNLADCFFKKISIDVAKTDSIQSNTLKLDRVTCSLEIRLTDKLPSNIERIGVNIDSLPGLFFAQTGERIAGSFYNDFPNQPNQAFWLTLYLMSSDKKVRVTVSGYSALNQVVLKKVIDNVYLRPNTKLVLQGTLSDGIVDNNGSMVITIDPDYAETNTINF